MKTLESFEDALNYVHRLGFQGSGSIVNRQYNLCQIVDMLCAAARNRNADKTDWQPFKVTFHRYQSGCYSFPWLSKFTIVRPDGTKCELHINYNRVAEIK